MSKENNNFPMTKLQWLWSNMKGCRGLFVTAILGTVVYNIMQLTVPYFSSKIVDMFLTGDEARVNLANHRDLFFKLIIMMVSFTVARVIIVYLDCMAYEYASQKTLYRVRNFLYDKIQRQDMKFYSTYRTGDLMTRVTGDLDAVRHMVAWVSRMIVESLSLYLATAVYLFIMNWKLALSVMIFSPFIFIIIIKFRTEVAPRHKALREKLAGMNTYAQENISGNRVVKAFAREDYEIEKFDHANQDFRDTNKVTQR
ncbi:MAG: ABC transporter ATP-binding protein, partial [Lachnospiraceae bacterium]|nr:ABC transporter ATP-binding protein [Lachnospiraceae bacterium]